MEGWTVWGRPQRPAHAPKAVAGIQERRSEFSLRAWKPSGLLTNPGRVLVYWSHYVGFQGPYMVGIALLAVWVDEVSLTLLG